MEGRYAAKAIAQRNTFPIKYSNMPTIMFFNPEVAAVGINEKQCQEEKIPYRVATYRYDMLNRAIAMRNCNGYVKIIVSDDDKQLILGMRAAGPQSAASIMSIAMMLDQRTGLKEVMKTVHPHPSITEGIQECLRVLQGKSIYKPEAFPESISIRQWKPSD